VLLWNGDFSTGDFVQYTSRGPNGEPPGKLLVARTASPPDLCQIVDHPVLPNQKAVHFRTHKGSNRDPAGDSPKLRTELEAPLIVPVDRVHTKFQGATLYLPTGRDGYIRFPEWHRPGQVAYGGPSNLRQCVLLETHGRPYAGSPPSALRIGNTDGKMDKFMVFEGAPNYGTRSVIPWSEIPGGNPRGIPIDFVIKTKWSRNSGEGLVRYMCNWGDGYRTFKFGGADAFRTSTIRNSNGGGPNNPRVKSYWNSNAIDVVDVIWSGHRFGTTFADADPRSHSEAIEVPTYDPRFPEEFRVIAKSEDQGRIGSRIEHAGWVELPAVGDLPAKRRYLKRSHVEPI